jgi:hypothetical protein
MDAVGFPLRDLYRWYTLAENGWYIFAEKHWYTVAEKGWHTCGRKLTTDREAQLFGLALKILESALAVLLVVEVSAGVDVFGLVFEHGVDDAGDFVSGGGNGSGGVGAGFDAAEEGAKIRIGAGKAVSGHSKGFGGAVLRLFGTGLDGLATGDVIVGADGEPGTVVSRELVA